MCGSLTVLPWIRRDLVFPPRQTSDGFDVSLLGDADVVTAHLAHALGLAVPPASNVAAAAATSGGSVPSPREPDAVLPRGAVWGRYARM